MLNLDEEIVVKYIDDDDDDDDDDKDDKDDDDDKDDKDDDDVVAVGPLIEQFQLEGQSPTGLHCA